MHPLVVALLVSLVATALSRWTPAEHAASLVGATFLLATFLLVPSERAQRYGLGFAGWLEPTPIDWTRTRRDCARACTWSLGAALLLFPPFTWGFVAWYEPGVEFSWQRAMLDLPVAWYDLLLGHLLVVALPEEAFFRGYLQSALDERWSGRVRFAGFELGHAIWITSLIFAAGHYAATPHPARCAVFFPSLVFGALRARTRGIGAGVLFHALCNVYSALLASGYGFETAR